jgi:cystathionine beta-lyase family protein involved in aluminum resistance
LLHYRKVWLNGAKWKQERSYSKEEFEQILIDITLVNPKHLSMLHRGYGEFPDSYELTKNGVDYIVEQFKKK